MREAVEEYLRGQLVVMLATSGESGLWACSVFYAYNDAELLFASSKNSKHGMDIGKGANVAFAITDTTQTPAKTAIGIQGTGYCRPARISEASKFIRHYATRFPKYSSTHGNLSNLVKLIKTADNRPYVLEIKQIKYTNKNLFETPQYFDFHRQAGKA